jgi:hypothetical protein
MIFQIISKRRFGNLIKITEKITGRDFILSEAELQDAAEKLHFWLTNPMDTNFSTLLYSLIAKADDENFKKLLKGFPVRTITYLLWYTSGDEQAFWDEYLTKKEKEHD